MKRDIHLAVGFLSFLFTCLYILVVQHIIESLVAPTEA